MIHTPYAHYRWLTLALSVLPRLLAQILARTKKNIYIIFFIYFFWNFTTIPAVFHLCNITGSNNCSTSKIPHCSLFNKMNYKFTVVNKSYKLTNDQRLKINPQPNHKYSYIYSNFIFFYEFFILLYNFTIFNQSIKIIFLTLTQQFIIYLINFN